MSKINKSVALQHFALVILALTTVLQSLKPKDELMLLM